jgi:alpha-methylacyl-CoA racemase
VAGALNGITVVELEGMGPAPFCAMILADMGAEVIRVERRRDRRRDPDEARRRDTFGRGRKSIIADLKAPEGRDLVLELAGTADVLIESFRPGVMERLGLGPDDVRAVNERLVYARMTGWGQSGPLAQTAGHDINYIAVAGALEPVGRAGQAPVPPLSLVGDFGGGGLTLAVGILAALLEAGRSGLGQVVDASCVDGASLLMSVVHHMRSVGRWNDERGTNLFDTGAPFYDVYETADGKYVSVGAVEPKFYTSLLGALGLDNDRMHPQYDRGAWPWRREQFRRVFAGRTRAEWEEAFHGVEACFAPVLSPAEAAAHPYHQERGAFVDVDGFAEPAPSPRFGRTPSAALPRPLPGGHTDNILRQLGWPDDRIAASRDAGTIQ